MNSVVDLEARQRALDPATSFIVQAPAGSGKTELLIQRYLVLLARVQNPEEVLAITFTNKAAGEMRARVINALELAKGEQPTKDPGNHTWTLARAVLKQAQKNDWALADHPARIRIQTIDALCSALTRQMPLLSRFGAQPTIADDTEPLYKEAARHTLAQLESGESWSNAIAFLLSHLDNDLVRVESLLVSMLKRRDQWLRHVADRENPRLERASLELAMQRAITDSLHAVYISIPAPLKETLFSNLQYASQNLASDKSTSPIAICAELTELPGATLPEQDYWTGIAELLLTGKGEWRSPKGINKKQGFPAPSSSKNKDEKARLSQAKENMKSLLGQLLEHGSLRGLLDDIRYLPPANYDDQQWLAIDALVELLPIAAAQLKLVFTETGSVDYTEVSQAALRALGSEQQPTDLALALDYRISHILIDEFQDTSLSQYELLQRLTAGWSVDDGRTLFVVGDPMQSIYRFREAEVGLYLRARHEGIGNVKLEPLTLSVNFRSQQGIVDWVNTVFSQVFPTEENISLGAVTYSPSHGWHGPETGQAVTVHPFIKINGNDQFQTNTKAEEASEILQIIKISKENAPENKIAILVRSRSTLSFILPLLRKAGLPFLALDIEHLGERQVVQDLLALTRALLHPGDRIAWLAILRAPWCGLSLTDLELLAGSEANNTLMARMTNNEITSQLSADGQQRLQRTREILQTVLQNRQRQNLRALVTGAWLALGGPGCVTNETDLEDVNVYLDLLDGVDEAGSVQDVSRLHEAITSLFARPDNQADDHLQVMTIHKAKGLEFDVVILPGIGQKSPPAGKQLLLWSERTSSEQHNDLLLAPIAASESKEDVIYNYLKRSDKERDHNENARLLYVAATRAKQGLHILGATNAKEKDNDLELQAPIEGSLLKLLWHELAPEYEKALVSQTGQAPAQGDLLNNNIDYLQVRGIQRLPADWTVPPAPASIKIAGALPAAPKAIAEIEFEWASATARHVGTVVHRVLMGLSRGESRERDSEHYYAKTLTSLGVPAAELKAAVAKVSQAISNTLADEKGKWILDKSHQQARSEFAISGLEAGKIKSLIIDRTFIDENNTRWIIDYKTASHEGGNLDAFLDREQERYQAQLVRYAQYMSKIDDRQIRLGLYFPLLKGWWEWGV